MIICNLCKAIINDTDPNMQDRILDHLEENHLFELLDFESKYPDAGTEEVIREFLEEGTEV